MTHPWLGNDGTLVARLAVGVVVLAWLGRLWRLRRSVGRYATFWQGQRTQSTDAAGGAQGGLLYIALGDSAAQGIGASSPSRGYVGLLATALERASGRPVQLVNLSVSGAKTADVVREQLPALARLPTPDLLTVAVGGNDLRRYDADGCAAALAALVAGLPVGPTVVADVPYFMHGHFERDAAAAAAMLRDLAGRRGLVIAQLHEQMRAQGWKAMGTSYAADWFHPNNRGHRTWQAAFWHAITADPALTARLGLPAP